jgi:hypothetical protein
MLSRSCTPVPLISRSISGPRKPVPSAAVSRHPRRVRKLSGRSRKSAPSRRASTLSRPKHLLGVSFFLCIASTCRPSSHDLSHLVAEYVKIVIMVQCASVDVFIVVPHAHFRYHRVTAERRDIILRTAYTTAAAFIRAKSSVLAVFDQDLGCYPPMSILAD